MIKQVIFDCDGVLVDTEIVAAKVMVDKLSSMGVDITIDHYFKTYTGSTFSGIFRELLPQVPSDEIRTLVEYCEHSVYEKLIPIKGMPELVKMIKLPAAVVSNSYLWQVNKAMQTIGLDQTITSRFSSEMVAKPKPAPDVYLYAAEHLNSKPEECLVIEDSKSGVIAAVAANMQVIGFTGGSHIQPGHVNALKQKGAIETASSANQLLLLINEIVKSS